MSENQENIEEKIEKLEKEKEEALKEIEKYSGKTFSIKLSQLTAKYINAKVELDALIVGYQVGKSVPREIILENKREERETIDLLKEENFKLAYLYLTGKLKEAQPSDNSENIDYTILFVRELPENFSVQSEEEYQILTSKIWTVYYLGIPRSFQRVKLKGYVVSNPSSNNIEIIAYETLPLEEDFENIKITKEDHEKFKKYFNEDIFDNICENEIAPHIVGISRALAKETLLLTLHSPLEIYDIFGRKIRGYIRTLWYGDTKTGKTEIGKDITYSHFKIGEIVFGEASSRAGITYTIDTEKRTIIWGVLPTNDRKFVFIDGLHGLGSLEMLQLREVFEQGIIKVSRMVSGERFARTRIVATLNPLKSISDYTYPIQGLKESPTLGGGPDISRWDLTFPFSAIDVSPKEIATAKPKDRPIPEEIFKKHVFWVWNLKPEDIRYTEEAKEKIQKYAEELLTKYFASDFQLIHNGIRDVLCRLSVAYACLLHSIKEEDGKFFVEVNASHVERAYEMKLAEIEYSYFDYYVESARKEKRITNEEVNKILKDLEENHKRILLELELERKTSSKLASALNVSIPTVKRYYQKLREYNLIETSPQGVKLTERGVQIVKILRGLPETRLKYPNSENEKKEEGGISESGITVSKMIPADASNGIKNDTVIPRTDIPPSQNSESLTQYGLSKNEENQTSTHKGKSWIIQQLEKDMIIWSKDKARFYDFDIIAFFKQNKILENLPDKEREELITEILNKWLKTGLLIQLSDGRYEFNVSKLAQVVK
jgi:DNA replicative helicase MCM subunit Mcm2 (Cdc46/Mcm family)